jgi:hypothetical protein
MLNRYLAILLLMLLVFSNCSRFFVYAGFEVNQKYIAAQLCENKARPWLNCNGRCYLMKKLKQVEQKEKKQEQEQKRSQYQEAIPAALSLNLAFNKPVQRKTYPRLPAPGVIERSLSIFQPPKIA